MPVVINDFEVVAEPRQPERDERAQQPQRATQRPVARWQEVERVLRHLRERQMRVRAD